MSEGILSIVVAAFNEEENVGPFRDAVSALFAGPLKGWGHEIVFVDDGSRDDTLQRLKTMAARDTHVKVVSFSRNFGQQAAFSAGLCYATGDAVVTMDCDLQDPPSIIPAMVRSWREGNRVVYARRVSREADSFVKRVTAGIYYRLLCQVSNVQIPRQVGDFRLMDRSVVTELVQLGEHAQYLRGLVAWLGFKHAFVDYERPDRQHGETHYSMRKMIKLAMDGLLSFSFLPLKVGLWIGVASILTSLALLAAMLLAHIIRHIPFPIYKWLVVGMFGFMGIQFIFLWVVGEYIGRIYNDVRRRPLYVVAERVNLPTVRAAAAAEVAPVQGADAFRP